MKKLLDELQQAALQRETRRHFLHTCSTGLGAMALGSFLESCGFAGTADKKAVQAPAAGSSDESPMAVRSAQFSGKAKRVIYIHMAGSPSQLELFDYKPELVKYNGKDCPQELLTGKKFAFIRGVPKMLGPQGKFAQHGQSGAWVSDYLPHLQGVVDDITFLKAMHTDQFNHAPAQLLMHTGSARLGRPSIGSWVTYGLGSENDNLPGYIVLASGGKQPDAGKSVWGSGFLPSVYQGVQCRTDGDPVLYASDPAGMPRNLRGKTIEAISAINQQQYNDVKDPEILTRIAQYELAYRMQMSVPDSMDIKGEPQYILDMYGVDPNQGSFARNCLLARRLVERGVRFVQLFDWGWDTHGTSADGSIDVGLHDKCRQSDQAVAALLRDLKQRGFAGRYAGGMGGRVWPDAHAGKPRRADAAVHGSGPPSGCVHGLDGRRGRKKGILLRRNGRYWLLRRERQSPRPRPAGHHPAPAGLRPRKIDLPVSGSPVPADRRGRESSEAYSGVAGTASGFCLDHSSFIIEIRPLNHSSRPQ